MDLSRVMSLIAHVYLLLALACWAVVAGARLIPPFALYLGAAGHSGILGSQPGDELESYRESRARYAQTEVVAEPVFFIVILDIS